VSTESEEHLNDRDRQALDAVSEEPPVEVQLENLRAENERLETEIEEVRDELEAWKRTFASRINDLGDRINGEDPTDPRRGSFYEDLTIIEKYSRMSESEREELLEGNTSKLRAILMFENWRDWSKTVDAGALISTNHTRGRYNKIAVKVDLQSATGETLENIEVYRAMKALARLSVQEPDDVQELTDEFGREHIRGGAFEYHDKVNPDSGSHFKIVKLVDPEAVHLP